MLRRKGKGTKAFSKLFYMTAYALALWKPERYTVIKA